MCHCEKEKRKKADYQIGRYNLYIFEMFLSRIGRLGVLFYSNQRPFIVSKTTYMWYNACSLRDIKDRIGIRCFWST